MNIIQRLQLLEPRFDPRRVPGLGFGWRFRDPRNGGVGLADGDGITICENWVDPRRAFYEPFTTTLREGWINVAGVLAIDTGKGYFSSDTNGDKAVREMGFADGVVSCVVSGDVDGGANESLPTVMVRYLDANNHLWVDFYSTTIRLVANLTGTPAVLATGVVTALVNGTSYTLEVVMNGNSVTVKWNGASIFTHTLSGGNTVFASYTKYGPRLVKGGTPATGARWDDFIVAKLTDEIQTTASAKPTYKVNIQNGKAVGRFDGGDALRAALVSLGAYTVFVAGKFSTAGMLVEQSATANTNSGFYVYSNTGYSVHVNRSTVLSSKNAATNWAAGNVAQIITSIHGGTHASLQLFVNGVAQALADGANNDDPGTAVVTDALNIGARDGSSVFITGDYYEILAYSAVLTTAQRRYIERGLSREHGLTLSA